MSIKTRDQVSKGDKWNVEDLYKDLNAWEEDFNKLIQSKAPPFWPEISQFRSKLASGPETLKKAFDTLFSIERSLEKLYTYAHLRHDEDIANDEYKKAYNRINAIFAAYKQEVAFFEPELLSLPEKTLKGYFESPYLKEYLFHLEKIVRFKPHLLSEDKEEMLALLIRPSQTASKAFSSLNNADLKFKSVKDSSGKEHVLTQGLYQLYLRSSDRELRKNAFFEVHGTYEAFQNTLTELISGQVENHFFQAKVRSFKSSLDAALFPHGVPSSVYRSLIDSVRKGLPSLHRYMSLRKKFLKVDALHPYDFYAPFVQEVEIQMDRQEAKECVIASVKPLGERYQELLKKGLNEEKWVDWEENLNKRSGAYSSGCFDSYPFILMNYRGTLRDVFTLAHEAGHSMQSLLSNQSQPFHYARYPIFVAEVASTFNEELLADYLLKKMTKKQERLFLIQEKVEDLRATFFRQTMFAEFELLLHENVEKGIPITPAFLKEIYFKLNQDYFGSEVVLDDILSIEWARIPHFYYNFYVYQYATGISAAIALSEKVLKGDDLAKENYITFLSSGGKDFPIELLKQAGVDMNKPDAVLATLRRFDTLVSTLEKELS